MIASSDSLDASDFDTNDAPADIIYSPDLDPNDLTHLNLAGLTIQSWLRDLHDRWRLARSLSSADYIGAIYFNLNNSPSDIRKSFRLSFYSSGISNSVDSVNPNSVADSASADLNSSNDTRMAINDLEANSLGELAELAENFILSNDREMLNLTLGLSADGKFIGELDHEE